MNLDPTTMKYVIRADLSAEGVVEKNDVVGAIFGQTEGLLGDELDLRDLQRSGRIGRIEVNVESKKGKSEGEIILPSSLDKVETVILAAALESIDRIGPCKAEVKVRSVEDVRVTKRQQVIERAKQLLQSLQASTAGASEDITEAVRELVRTEEIVSYGPDRLPAGPNVSKSDTIIIVEGRNDVLNLLRHGITNAISTEGAAIPPTIKNLTKEKTAIAFVDGDRGGELILKELLQVAEIDFIARAPRGWEVEELTQKQIQKALRNKIPAEQFTEMYSTEGGRAPPKDNVRSREKPWTPPRTEEAPSPSPAWVESEEPSTPPAAPKKPDRETLLLRTLADLEDMDQNQGKGLQAILLDSEENPLGEPIPVGSLVKTLEGIEPGKVKSIVFHGVITQRLLDLAADKKISTLVATKVGNVTKRPEGVEILTRSSLEGEKV